MLPCWKMHLCIKATMNLLENVPVRHMSNLRRVMRILPQPIVVVTSAMAHPNYGVIRRGVTCSSLTSLTLEPPTILISIYHKNVINDVIEKCQHFAANLLSNKQLKAGMHFAKGLSSELGYNQFEDFEHSCGLNGLPLLTDSVGILQCEVSDVNVVGDHRVWYGTVKEAHISSDEAVHPMLYYQRSFRTIGDEIFMQAFENTRLPFEEWTHEAHLRMSWNYISQYGKDAATPLIRQGILKFNEINKDKVTYGYSETVTIFYIHVMSKAILSMPAEHSFEDFLLCNQHLTDKNYLLQYYSPNVLSNSESKQRFFEPDRLTLP